LSSGALAALQDAPRAFGLVYAGLSPVDDGRSWEVIDVGAWESPLELERLQVYSG
jgi:hypothetical protein